MKNCHCDCTIASNMLQLFYCEYIICHTLHKLKCSIQTPAISRSQPKTVIYLQHVSGALLAMVYIYLQWQFLFNRNDNRITRLQAVSRRYHSTALEMYSIACTCNGLLGTVFKWFTCNDNFHLIEIIIAKSHVKAYEKPFPCSFIFATVLYILAIVYLQGQFL